MAPSTLPPRARALLWADGLAGASVGVLVLLLHSWFAALYGLSAPLVLGLGAANLAYGSYSSTLAVRMRLGHPPSRRAVVALVVANAAWAVACVVLAVVLRERATAIGTSVLVIEAVFVGGLAMLERRFVLPHLHIDRSAITVARGPRGRARSHRRARRARADRPMRP